MIIETARTTLRMFTMDDLDALAPILGSESVMRFLGIDPQPLSFEESREILESILRHWQRRGFGRLAIVFKEDNRLIGMAGFRNYDESPEIFYLLDEPYWGKGLATEIAAALLKWGFETKNFERIIGITRINHQRSINVMKKLGFKFDKNQDIFGVDAVIYAIKREEYELIIDKS